MCVVSMVMDHYRDKWGPRVPPQPWQYDENFWIPLPHPADQKEREAAFQKALAQMAKPKVPAITAEEIEEFRRLLERAREYDRRNHEPECEMDEKRQAIIAIARQLGVEISFV